MEALSDAGAYSAMVPFLPAFIDELHGIFGEDFWPFGIKENAATLEKLVLYAHQQGLTPRVLSVDELFGEAQAVIKSLGRVYKDIQGVSGATILGDGTVALIVDVPSLVQSVINEGPSVSGSMAGETCLVGDA